MPVANCRSRGGEGGDPSRAGVPVRFRQAGARGRFRPETVTQPEIRKRLTMRTAKLNAFGACRALVLAAALVAGPVIAGAAHAQAIDPYQPMNDGSEQASATVPPGVVAPGYDPGVRAANAREGEALATENREAAAEAAQDRSAYQAAVQDYHQAVAQRRQAIARIHATQARRDAAYGQAMADWHAQVDACHNGNHRACVAPPAG